MRHLLQPPGVIQLVDLRAQNQLLTSFVEVRSRYALIPLAIAKAVGSTRVDGVKLSLQLEKKGDHFEEQILWGGTM